MSGGDRRARFRALHVRDQLFVMPNPWDVGSARLLASCGFEALATTSAGFAWSLGKHDQTVSPSRAPSTARHANSATVRFDARREGATVLACGSSPDRVGAMSRALAEVDLAAVVAIWRKRDRDLGRARPV